MEARQRAFLVSHGSFNPVHRHHIEMMVKAREVLEAAGFDVIRGILGITNQGYLSSKLPGEAMLVEHRVAAIRAGCGGPLSWLSADPRGEDFRSVGAMINGLKHELAAEARGAVIFRVLGADVLRRYKGERSGSQPTVLICRAGDTEAAREYARVSPRTCFLVEELPGNFSSTRVRAALRSGDAVSVQELCGENVASYLFEHKEQLFGHIVRAPALATTFAPKSLVVGVTGATRSGKTTLAWNLAAEAPESITVVEQDKFRLRGGGGGNKYIEKDGHKLVNWERTEATDWPKLGQAILKAAQQSRVVIVEGYCLLHSSEVCAMLGGLIWVEVDASTCLHRRTTTSNVPRGWDPDSYFEECIWPFHSRYRASVFGQHSELGFDGTSLAFDGRVLSVDGTQPPEESCSRAAQELQRWQADPGKCESAVREMISTLSTKNVDNRLLDITEAPKEADHRRWGRKR